ncbi:hypothetical protein [Limnohabitans sp.]|uniref:hypothetical protein n=1 Tax=Limnohabitans sp. TaxID=1907725 RepID=UPI0035AF531E
MGSIVKESVNRGGKQVTRYRAHVRRTGFKSQSKSFYSHAEAKAWLRNAESDAEQKKDQDKGIYRFSAVADLFAKTPPRRGTKFWSPTHLGYWEEQFGTRDIKTITRADINVSLAALQVKKVERRTITGQIKQAERPISSSTANRYLASLSSVFNFALDAGLIDRHPIKGGQVRKLTEGSGRTRILTTEEEDRLIAEAERSTWPPMALTNPFYAMKYKDCGDIVQSAWLLDEAFWKLHDYQPEDYLTEGVLTASQRFNRKGKTTDDTSKAMALLQKYGIVTAPRGNDETPGTQGWIRKRVGFETSLCPRTIDGLASTLRKAAKLQKGIATN